MKKKHGRPIVTHRAPKKKGKLEVRQFRDLTEAVEYIERNTAPRTHGKPGRILTGEV